jgi:heptosyltransferase III
VLLDLRKVKFDYVFEVGDGHRARIITMLSRSKRRYSVNTESPPTLLERLRFTAVSSFDWQTCHRVERDFLSVAEFLELPRVIPPLRFDRRLAQTWDQGRDLVDFAVVQIGTRESANRWNREGWRSVCRHLLVNREVVVVACGSVHHEVEQAEWLQKELGPRVLCTKGHATWPQMADLLYRARLYVGLNTAMMHLAAACSCPVVALFGPSLEEYWYPWQIPHRIVTSHDLTSTNDTVKRHAQVQKRSMNGIQVDDVIAACLTLARTVDAQKGQLK